MSMCTLSGVANSLTGGFGRTLIWGGCTAYGLKNFISGKNSIFSTNPQVAVFNLLFYAFGVPMAIEGVHSFAARHYYTNCSDDSTKKAAAPYFK